MKLLKYFIPLLLIWSVLGIAQERDYNQWYQDHEWLMLKQEKTNWSPLKDNQAREKFIEKFLTARDPDTFTYKNEFELIYQVNLEKAKQIFSNKNDFRRYVYFLLGEPTKKSVSGDQSVIITPSLSDASDAIKIRVAESEIWKYDFGKQKFEIIFAKLDPCQLQQFKDYQSKDDVLLSSFYSNNYEILYAGPNVYNSINTFLEEFFAGGFRLGNTKDTIDNFKKPILERAEAFYKQKMPRVQTESYSSTLQGNELQIYIHQFEIESPQEAGIAIWCAFGKSTLDVRHKDEFAADMSIFCSIKDLSGKQVIYYCDDKANYKLKEQKDYYYTFWGSLPPGKYKLVLEIGENIKEKHYKSEMDIEIFDWSMPGLKADLLIGKIFDNSDKMIQGKQLYSPVSGGIFGPALGRCYFRDDDTLIAIFKITGFKRNNYGNPRIELELVFEKGDVEQGEFVPTGEVYSCRYLPIEDSASCVEGTMNLNIRDITKKLKMSSGLYRVKLDIKDKVANEEGSKTHPYPIMILTSGDNAK